MEIFVAAKQCSEIIHTVARESHDCNMSMDLQNFLSSFPLSCSTCSRGFSAELDRLPRSIYTRSPTNKQWEKWCYWISLLHVSDLTAERGEQSDIAKSTTVFFLLCRDRKNFFSNNRFVEYGKIVDFAALFHCSNLARLPIPFRSLALAVPSSALHLHCVAAQEQVLEEPGEDRENFSFCHRDNI